MIRVVLVHGWGYDAGVWNPLRALLPAEWQVDALDFGYFGEPHMRPAAANPGDVTIAVGHSLGALWWLTQATAPWNKLLCINGFPRFCTGDGYAPAVSPRVLARMQAQFAAQPQAVLDDFHARCGAAGPTSTAVPERLAAGLTALAQWDGREALNLRRNDIHALYGNDDPIVTSAMSAAAFAPLPAGQQREISLPGHMLPVHAPEICAQWLRQLVP